GHILQLLDASSRWGSAPVLHLALHIFRGGITEMKNRLWMLLIVVGLFTCVPAVAQSTFGSILGTIQDPSGSAIGTGAVEITNLDDNSTRKTTSNDTGLYQFLNLPAGRYTLSATKAGFNTTRVSGVVLEARQVRRLDLTLALAAVQQTVEVQAASA